MYREAIDYISNIQRSGVELGIERMRELLVLLGEPDRSLKFVHVAGTNGKGSVCAYMTAALKEAGYRVGTYNSPSVFGYNERWLIDGQPLSDSLVAKYIFCVKDAIDAENKLRSAFGAEKFAPTAFEIETAVAMLAFYEQECDICVLETGLGGRWDATNVVYDKELAVITPIGLDHCAYLGNTLGEIADEKAAIIKNDAVTCMQCDEVMNALRHPYIEQGGKRKDIKANLVVCGSPKLIEKSLDGQKFELDGDAYFIKMPGAHQLENAAIAITVLKTLAKKHWQISDEQIKNGLAKAIWQGRFEVIRGENRFNIDIPQGKLLILDGAHNPHGAEALRAAVNDYLSGKKLHLVTGILADKDVDGILKILLPLASNITCVTPPSPRALDKYDLKAAADKVLKQCGKTVRAQVADDIKVAVQDALSGDCDVVLLAGSLTLFEGLTNRGDKQ